MHKANRRKSKRLFVERLEAREVPATFVVTTTADVVDPADHRVSLREAINIANTRKGADTIVLGTGSYEIHKAENLANPDDNGGGDFDISDSTTIRGAGAGRTFVDGGGTVRVFDVINAINASFVNLTIRNGGGPNNGSGIHSHVGNVTLINSTASGNSSHNGGAISDEGGNVTLIRSTVSGNFAQGDGGGICMVGAVLSISDSKIIGNTAGGSGGGVNSSGDFQPSRSVISGNRAGTSGGGVFAANIEAVNSTISSNSALEAGGIFADKAVMDGCTISDNAALTSSGGGIEAKAVGMKNTTITGKFAIYGGGVALLSGGASGQLGIFRNVTITRNVAQFAGGIDGDLTESIGIVNSIVAQNLNLAGGSDPDVFGSLVSAGHNLIGDPTGSIGSGFSAPGDQVGTAANPLDPRLGPLANNGGPTMTCALLTGSPAIDAGDNSAAKTLDQRGRKRIRDGNHDGKAIVDIGAFER